MNTAHIEAGHERNNLGQKAIASAVAGTILVGLAFVAYETGQYFDQHFRPGRGIQEQLGIHPKAAAIASQLQTGFAHLQIQNPGDTIRHPHGDR